MDNHGYDEGLAELMYKFVEYKNTLPHDHPDVMKLVAKYQRFMNKNYYDNSLTDELFEALGRMYAGDDFAPKIDVFEKGTADYMSRAIAVYCSK